MLIFTPSVSFITAESNGICVNTSCTGVFGLLQSGEADLGMYPQPISAFDDFKQMFVEPMPFGDVITHNIITTIDSDLKTQSLDLISACQVYNKLICFMYVGCMIPCLFLLWKMTQVKFANVFWNTVSMWFRQGSRFYVTTTRHGTRIILAALAIGTFLFVSVGLNLLSTDMVSTPSIDFVDTIEELAEKDTKLLLLQGTGNDELISKSKKSSYKQLWSKQNKKITSDLVEMATLLGSGEYSSVDKSKVFDFAERYNCLDKVLDNQRQPANKFYVSKEPVYKEWWVPSVRKFTSPVREELIRRMIRLNGFVAQSGLPQHEQNHEAIEAVTQLFAGGDNSLEFPVDRCVCNKKYMKQNSDYVRAVATSDVSRLLYIAMLLNVLAITIVVAEKITKPKRRQAWA